MGKFIFTAIITCIFGFHCCFERFSYDLEMKTPKPKKKQQTNGCKDFMPEELSRNQSILRCEVILQHDWAVEQCLFHIRAFFGG